MMHHTPDPWRVDHAALHRLAVNPAYLCVISQVLIDGTELDCVVATVPQSTHAEADARLMAAAPSLLAACQHALRMLDRDGIRPLRGTACIDNDMAFIRAAITQAVRT